MKKTKWLLLALALVLSMFLAACSSSNEDNTAGNDKDKAGQTDTNKDTSGDKEPAKDDQPHVLNVLDGAEIPSMDPGIVSDAIGIQFISATMEGLYRQAPGGEIVDGLAYVDKQEVSEDGLTWTFHLRDNATWENGDPVVAGDFVYAWRRAIDPALKSPYAPYLMNNVVANATEISKGEKKPEELGVEAPDDTTLVVHLVNPTPYFDNFAAFPTFYPLNQKFVEAQGDKFALEADNMLSNGPFKMTSWEHEAGWVLEKNDTYWDKDNVDLDKVNVKVVKDRATAVNLYETGKIDRVGLAGDFVDKYKADPNIHYVPEATLFYLQFNQDSKTAGKYMKNKNFRLALAQAWDKSGYADVILGNGSIPANFYVPGIFFQGPKGTKYEGKTFRETNGDFTQGSYNVDKAQEAWAKAKEELGFDTVTISYLTGDSENSKLTAEFLKNTFETTLPGLTIETKTVPFKERLRLEKAHDFEISLSGWGPDYNDPMSFLDLWVTGGEYNQIGYSNPDYDKLIKDAKTVHATDAAARWEDMLNAEKILMEDAPISPMYQRSNAQLIPPYIVNMDTLNPYGADYSYKFVKLDLSKKK